MKKWVMSFILVLLWVSTVWAVGTVTQDRLVTGDAVAIIFNYTADASNGSIPTTAINSENMGYLKNKYLHSVWTVPGSPAPDAADVKVIDSVTGSDWLDTKGVNLIHATIPYHTNGYNSLPDMYVFDPVWCTLSIEVSNQSTNSAKGKIILLFR